MKISLDWINSRLRHCGRKEEHTEFGRYINRNYPNGSIGEKKVKKIKSIDTPMVS